MKKAGLGILISLLTTGVFGQDVPKPASNDNTLLWKISGNGLEKPSYLFGTIHMLCSDQAYLSESLKTAIRNCDQVYLEVDMDNLFEMLGLLKSMKMNGDTTLADLLSQEDYDLVKDYFEKNSSLLPFSMLETYKPMLAASTLLEASVNCESAVAMEQLIMEEAKEQKKTINGLETMAYQMSIFDSIPYGVQAKQLTAYIKKLESGEDDNSEYDAMVDAYKNQDLGKIEKITVSSEMGMADYSDLLLYNRNRNWVKKLKGILPGKSLVIAVGAGHLAGKNGLIDLLRKAGYRLTPIDNTARKTTTI